VGPPFRVFENGCQQVYSSLDRHPIDSVGWAFALDTVLEFVDREARQASKRRKMFCPSCGKEIPEESRFCLGCGKEIHVIAVPAVVPSAPTRLPEIRRSFGGLRVLLIILAGLIVIAGVVVYHDSTTSRASGATAIVAGASATGPIAPAAKLAQSPAPVKLSPGEIASKYADSVVVLENYNDQGQKTLQGSGFISSPDGVLLTNYHVIRGASRMVARTHDQSIHDVDYVIAFDMQHDIAALKMSGGALPSVHLGDSMAIKTGDHVTVLGAPLGLESTLSDGIISAVREAGSFRIFQTSAPISHGSSGGPLFDDYGNVIALAVATMATGENLNFAVPIDLAKTLLKSERQISFAELLSSTAVHQSILTSTISVPPQVMTLDIAVPQQGGVLAGSFSIAGGMGNDLGVSLVANNGGILWNGGLIQRSGSLNLPLRGGRYQLILNNKMGPFWVSSKTVSGTIELSYYR
jgi:S1-C subfamily serine protease